MLCKQPLSRIPSWFAFYSIYQEYSRMPVCTSRHESVVLGGEKEQLSSVGMSRESRYLVHSSYAEGAPNTVTPCIRLDECSQLTLADIEFGERSGRVTIRSGKGNKARTVPLNASARAALAEYLAPRLDCEQTVKAVTAAWPRSASHLRSFPLWRSQKGGVLTTSAMRQMLDIMVRDAAARGLVPANTSAHTLRHTFARNYLAENPGDVVGLAALLGHTSLDTTRIYSQPTIEHLAKRVEQLSQNAYSE
jgi:site-specific recombinase XerD